MPAGVARSIEGELGKDERFIAVLDGLALGRKDAYAAVFAMEKVFNFKRLRPGDRYVVQLAGDGTLGGFSIIKSPLEVYAVERGEDGYVAQRVEVAVRREQVAVSGEVRSSLWQAILDAGEHASLLGLMVEVFEWDVDFNSDTRAGDQFAVIAEKVFVGDEFVRYEGLEAAAYDGPAAGQRRVVAWTDAAGSDGFFDAAGRSVRKAFLKSPLKFTRISSGFSKRRRHPILHRTRAHLGVDYAAPTGTPVRAIGDGRVTFAGWKGGNGRLVSITHPNGYRSSYAHLSAIGKGIRQGAKVEQRQVIGRVGATGLATGPHLHFGLWRAGTFVNPMTVERVPDRAVPSEQRAAYQRHARPLLTRLDALLAAALADGVWPP